MPCHLVNGFLKWHPSNIRGRGYNLIKCNKRTDSNRITFIRLFHTYNIQAMQPKQYNNCTLVTLTFTYRHLKKHMFINHGHETVWFCFFIILSVSFLWHFILWASIKFGNNFQGYFWKEFGIHLAQMNGTESGVKSKEKLNLNPSKYLNTSKYCKHDSPQLFILCLPVDNFNIFVRFK